MTNEDDLKELDELELETPDEGAGLPELTDEGLSHFDEETDLLAEPMAAPTAAPAAAPLPGGAGAVAEEAPAADPGAGQWVWQYGAPAPPPSFLAVFFSGTAVNDLYRRFACALLVVIGCLLPWSDVVTTPASGDTAASTVVNYTPGVELPLGALSLVLGLWLLFSSCYGIYTSRQKILPVFLMIEPALVSWSRALDVWAECKAGGLDGLIEFSHKAGTGVLLTLVGSTWVAGGFLFLFVKVFAKKDVDKGAARRSARSAKDGEAAAEGPAGDDDKKGARRGRKR
ncbi:MAG: hypothetical protein H6825_15775 [Planctomycetes bacterium]|nr:hypothetical protein [Planctomycetota bacterium]